MKKLFISALVFGAIFTSCSDDDDFSYEILSDDAIEAVKIPEGFYMVNEGWFGHDQGSVNYFKGKGNSYDIKYNVYAAANGGENLGLTTCHAAIWGDNIYFVSKQGNRLIVADAKTLAKKAVIEELGGERIDGRAFQGIDDKKAYISTSDGIVSFDLSTNTLGSKVQGIEGQVGSMAYSNGSLFAISANAIYIIDPLTDKIIKQMEGNCLQLTMDRQGRIIVAQNENMVVIDPVTFEQETMAYPDNSKPASVWGGWNPGSLCASMQSDDLYWSAANGWAGGKTIYKTNLETKSSNLIYTFGKSENDVNVELYGAGLRVNPHTNELLATVTQSGWGNNFKWNWVYKFDAAGTETARINVLNEEGEGYFWYPELPVFEDANKPQIILNQVILKGGVKAEYDLTEKIIDHDNIFATMSIAAESTTPNIAKVSIEGKTLVVEPGMEKGLGTFTLSVVSNGVKVNKTIQVINE